MRALIASDDPALSFQLREALGRLGHDCPASQVVSLDSAASRLANRAQDSEPELLFVILAPDVDRALQTLRDTRRRTAQPLFAVGPATDPKQVLRTIREGAHEYLDQDDLTAELTAALDRLKAGDVQRAASRTIAILPASGGCGCSTLAANLSAGLAKLAGNCVLLDLNAEAGDLSPLLDLKPTYTLADLCRNVGRLDRSLLEGALAAHRSGVKVLAAPLQIADASHVTAEGVRRIMSLATELAPFVVADLPRAYRSASMQAIVEADEILLVLRLDFTSLRNARRVIEHLKDLRPNAEQVRIVVNRHRQPGELAAADAEAALGVKISHYVIDDPKLINRANNNGAPIVAQSPSAKASVQIAALAAELQRIAEA